MDLLINGFIKDMECMDHVFVLKHMTEECREKERRRIGEGFVVF